MFVQNGQKKSENKKTILIIGADGFLGLNTVKAFIENGYFVYAVVNDGIPKYLVDSINVEILDTNFKDKNSYKCLKTLNLDSVIHIPPDEFEPKDDEETEKAHFKSLKKFSKVPFKNKIIHIFAQIARISLTISITYYEASAGKIPLSYTSSASGANT